MIMESPQPTETLKCTQLGILPKHFAFNQCCDPICSLLFPRNEHSWNLEMEYVEERVLKCTCVAQLQYYRTDFLSNMVSVSCTVMVSSFSNILLMHVFKLKASIYISCNKIKKICEWNIITGF